MAVVGSVDAAVLGTYAQDLSAAISLLNSTVSSISQNLSALGIEVDGIDAELTNLLTNLTPLVMSFPPTVHPDNVNTDCNSLPYGKHVVYSDGANATTPAPSGLYYFEVLYISEEDGATVIGQRAWRFSTGLLYTRLLRFGVWTTWNKVG